MIASYLKAQYRQLYGRMARLPGPGLNLTYADGFKHGFESGQSACVGDLSVTALTKELIDRGELDLAAQLLEELKAHQ